MFLTYKCIIEISTFLFGKRSTFSSSLSSDCELGEADETAAFVGAGGGEPVAFFFLLFFMNSLCHK